MKIDRKEYLGNGCRLLTNSFDDHNQLISMLERDDRVAIFRCGQNFWSKDRDQYAFYVAIRDLDQDQQEYIDRLIADFGKPPENQTTSKTTQKQDTLLNTTPEEIPSEKMDKIKNEHPVETKASARDSLIETLEPLSRKIDAVFKQIEANEKKLAERIDEIKVDSLKRMVQLQNKEDSGVLEELDKEHREKLNRIEYEHRQQLKVLTEEINRLQKENEKLQSDLAWLEKEAGAGGFDNEHNPLATMGSMISHFRDISAQYPIVVHDNAVKYASRSSSKKRVEVLNLLFDLRELAFIRYKKGKNSIGNLKEWFDSRGYGYGLKDSETTTGKYGDERVIFYENESIQLKHHITLFPNNSDCIQVYFHFDEKNRKLVIGYCGEHLRISSRAN